tara:strand:- start:210 stop:671 length:462 start_codon:yes stop_codon:yes gene_type:complete
MENWNKFLNEAVDKDGDGRVVPDWAQGKKPPKWADQDDNDPEVGDALSEAEEDPIEEADEGAFSPSHYCVHHGGVHHEGRIIEAEAIQHNYNSDLGKVTHYDMKLPDGTILEDVATEDILITNASLAEAHGKRDHKKIKEKKCPSCKKAPCEC